MMIELTTANSLMIELTTANDWVLSTSSGQHKVGGGQLRTKNAMSLWVEGLGGILIPLFAE